MRIRRRIVAVLPDEEPGRSAGRNQPRRRESLWEAILALVVALVAMAGWGLVLLLLERTGGL